MIRISKLLLLATFISLSAAYASPQPVLAIAGLQPEPFALQAGYGFGQGYGQGQGQVITCSSDDGRRNYCNVDTRRGVRLNRQISGSPCVENQTWGVDNRGLWVDRGCRAEFSFGGGGWRPGQGQGPDQSQIITCSSDDGRRNFCSINGYNSNSVVLTRQISGSPCVQNQTWGIDRRRGLWVDRGCRAEFQVNR